MHTASSELLGRLGVRPITYNRAGDGRNTIGWKLIQRHWCDLIEVAIAISERWLSSSTSMCGLRSNFRRNQIFEMFREVDRSVRTVALLRYLADPALLTRVTAATDNVESYHSFTKPLSFGNNGVRADNGPVEQEELIECNALLAILVIFRNGVDITDAVVGLVAKGWTVSVDQLAALSTYLRAHISRCGAYVTDELTHQADPFDMALTEVDFTTLDLVV